MNLIQFRNSLKFNNNFTIANKIGYIFLMKGVAFIRNIQPNLSFIWDSSFLKFQLQSFLIDFLKKAISHFKSNCFQTTSNGICLILV